MSTAVCERLKAVWVDEFHQHHKGLYYTIRAHNGPHPTFYTVWNGDGQCRVTFRTYKSFKGAVYAATKRIDNLLRKGPK